MDSISTTKHLELFNPGFKRGQVLASFKQFSHLPAELQLYVWKLVLSRARFLQLKLDDDRQAKGGARNNNQQEGSSVGYFVSVVGHQVLSKILHVNRDARTAALRFYRIHLPCTFIQVPDGESLEFVSPTVRTSSHLHQNDTLYINPEWDILHLHRGSGCGNKMHFVDFLLQMKSLDCVGRGLLHLGLSNGATKLFRFRMSELSSATRIDFLRSIESLKFVYFLSLECVGRVYHGDLDSISRERGWELHRSRPIFSAVPGFDRLSRDPRPIEKDLRNVFVGTGDPRRRVYSWKKHLESWGAQPKCEYRFVVTFVPHSSILDRNTATDWVKKEDGEWTNLQLKNLDEIVSRGGTFPVESTAELEVAPQPAIGSWVFPIDAMGEIPDTKKGRRNALRFFRSKRVLDMSQYWPELWLSVLP